jgi:hypothetical protein
MAVSLCRNLGQTCRTHQVRRDGGDVSDCLVAMNVGNTNASRIWRDPADCAAEKFVVNSHCNKSKGAAPSVAVHHCSVVCPWAQTAKPGDVNSRPSRAVIKLAVSVSCLYYVTALKSS